jgi:hypothetical protein
VRRQRPRDRRAAEQRDELAASHVLPSSRGSHPTTSLKKLCCASQHFGSPDFRPERGQRRPSQRLPL